MLKTKKGRLLIAFLLSAITFNNTYTMDRPEEEGILGWVAVVGGVLLGAVAMKYLWQSQPNEPFLFSELPQDMQNKIIELASLYSTAESIDIAAQTINSLAQVNKELNQKINDPKFCLQLIKHLSEKFSLSNEVVTKKLQTQEAKRRLALQKQLYDACTFEIDFEPIKNAYYNGADLEFTYEMPPLAPTPLLLFIYNLTVVDEIFAQKNLQQLLTLPININHAEPKQGKTALMIACQKFYRAAWAIPIFLTNPNIKINQQDNDGNTALMLYVKFGGQLSEQILKDFITAGANPNLANFAGETPLQELVRANPHTLEAVNNYLRETQQK